MALPKWSFTVITQEEFDARRKATAVAATTAALPAKPPRQFSAPVGVVSKLKKKTESFSSTNLDCTLPNAQVTIPVFAMLHVPTTITIIYAHSLSLVCYYFCRHPILACRPRVRHLRNFPLDREIIRRKL